MNKIAILTATYNHPDKLSELYNSLLAQENKNFTWCIVDDGSEITTENMVKNFQSKLELDILYYRKENGGKSRAITFGLDKLLNYNFVVFIDDDEYLYPEAIDIITNYEAKYRDSNVVMINFNRADQNGKIIAKKISENDEIMSNQERKRKGYYEDGYTGYYMSKLKQIRSPYFLGEKYVGPSVLTMLAGRTYDILFSKSSTILGTTEYLEGGITKQGRRLRVKNPKGMYVYCLLRQHPDSGMFLRLVYSVYGYAYLNYGKLSEYEVRKELNDEFPEKLIPLAKPFGIILSKYWKLKFL